MHKSQRYDPMTHIKDRKADHINICLNEITEPSYNYWNDIRLIHEALPEVDIDEIDTSCDVLGSRLDFPLIVTAITGGFPGATKINRNIASACAELGIGMGVGSERAGIDGVDTESYEVIKDYDVPLVIGNVGAPQLVAQKRKRTYGVEDVKRARELVDADYVAIHLNFLQEVVQPEGDTNARGCYDAIKNIARECPVIVKETGAGISAETVQRLSGIGINAIDLAGMGGTSFSAVELYRARKAGDSVRTSVGETFFDWGIPTPVSLMCAGKSLPLIASGGIRTGLDIARAIALGGTCAGAANLVLAEAVESAEAVKKRLITIKEELRAAMLLTGSLDIETLSKKRYVVLGDTEKWMRGMSKWM